MIYIAPNTEDFPVTLFLSARFHFRHVEIPELISQYLTFLSHQNIRLEKEKRLTNAEHKKSIQ